jgi:hypothetical protein
MVVYLVFVMERQCTFCEVEGDYLNITKSISGFQELKYVIHVEVSVFEGLKKTSIPPDILSSHSAPYLRTVLINTPWVF